MRAGDGLDSESNQVDGTQLDAEVGREDADATQQASDEAQDLAIALMCLRWLWLIEHFVLGVAIALMCLSLIHI